jgi:F420-dependent oxidoreductase-like protein
LVRVEVGVHFFNQTLSGGPSALATHVRDTAEAAENAGCTMFTCMDHYFQMEGFTHAEDPMLEGYTTLGYAAGCTEKMRLGLLVTGVSYRYPGLLAKIVTTLDVLSCGRAMLGIGAAWYEREHLALGVPFYPIAERLERLEETLQICLQMWSDDDGPYEGVHYRLAETLNAPPSLQRPHPPIMIGGGGERKLLRLVARYADANNLFPTSPEQVQHKLDVLARHCEDIGRDRSEIRNTTISRISADTDIDAFVADMTAYAALGFEHVQLGLLGDEPAQLIERAVTKIVPRLAEL